MKIEESIGRFNIRKTLRFEMKPIGRTADFLAGHLETDEERAASLNKVKAAIEAEHLMMVRRVFKQLPDPIPAQYDAVRTAFRKDPEFAALSNRDARDVMQTILKRCRANGWAIPKELTNHDGWPTLTVKWHWHCFSKYDPSAANSLIRAWPGKSKREVEAKSPLLRAPRRRRPSRNYWFDHSPFRVMFGNRSVGMNWERGDYNLSRTFLLTDGERIIIGITPRESKFSPYALPDGSETEPSYSLYEEDEGKNPRMRPVPKALVDAPASRGFVYLFELAGRGLRGRTNLNALYLRALLSSANLSDPVFHLRRGCEFFVRKGTEIPRDGKPDHFRQRFTEDKFFVSLPVILNSQMVAINSGCAAYGDLTRFLADNPTAKFITVPARSPTVPSRSTTVPSALSRPSAVSLRSAVTGAGKFSLSLLAGELAKRAVDEDAYVIFDPKTPKKVLEAVERKFNYIVIRGRDPLEPGGVLRGYQIPHRLFVGDLAAATRAAAQNRALHEAKEREREAAEKLRAEKSAAKAAAREKAEAELRAAQERRRKMEEIVRNSRPIALLDPIFSEGRYTFRFTYKTSDNVRHEDTCKGNEKEDVYQKLRTIKVRPMKVWCDDPAYTVPSALSPTGADIATRLKQLDALRSQSLITEAEYTAQRAKIISEI